MEIVGRTRTAPSPRGRGGSTSGYQTGPAPPTQGMPTVGSVAWYSGPPNIYRHSDNSPKSQGVICGRRMANLCAANAMPGSGYIKAVPDNTDNRRLCANN